MAAIFKTQRQLAKFGGKDYTVSSERGLITVERPEDHFVTRFANGNSYNAFVEQFNDPTFVPVADNESFNCSMCDGLDYCKNMCW